MCVEMDEAHGTLLDGGGKFDAPEHEGHDQIVPVGASECGES